MIIKPRRGVTLIAVGATHGISGREHVLAGFLGACPELVEEQHAKIMTKQKIVNQ